MKRLILFTILLTSGICFSALPNDKYFKRFERPNGCSYAYILISTNMTSQRIPESSHRLATKTVVTNGVTNVVEKTLEEFVTFVQDNGDGTAVVKLSAKQIDTGGRWTPTTTKDLKQWYPYLAEYGKTNWMTYSEFRKSYPNETRKYE